MKHERGNSRVYLRDCVEAMKEYPDGYWDLAVCDPPYGIGAEQMQRGNSKINPDKSKNWDCEPPTQEYFDELFRVYQQQIIWGGNYFQLPPSQYFCIWDKGETMYGRDFAECEYAWVSSGGTRIFKKGPNQNDRIHPTQKPVALYDYIFHHYAKEGDKILDTHLGSQSSRIAAWKHVLDFTAFETDPDYFAQGNTRFDRFANQLTMF